MKYIAPVAELVALETVSVILTSTVEESTTASTPACPVQTESERD